MPPRRKFELNPAFANAHGLSDAADNADPWSQLDKELSNANSTLTKLAKAVEESRKTGKLMLSSIDLKLPLPKAMFDIRADLIAAYDGTAIDSDDKFWECHSEETLTLLDISDNDLSMKSANACRHHPHWWWLGSIQLEAPSLPPSEPLAVVSISRILLH